MAYRPPVSPDDFAALRRQSEGLRKITDGRFEALPWSWGENRLTRRAPDGWKLTVYRQSDGSIEACVLKPDGTSQTFS